MERRQSAPPTAPNQRGFRGKYESPGSGPVLGGAFVDEQGTIEIGYAVVESQWNRGYATAAVEALVTKAREDSTVRRIVAYTPLERPESGRVLEKAGFGLVREMEDEDAEGNVVRVKEWELAT